MIAPPRLSAGNRDKALDWCTAVILRSGVVADLESRLRPPTTRRRRGAPTTYGQYTVQGVLTVMLYLALDDKPASNAMIMELLWTDAGFTDAQMERIGLGSLRHIGNRQHAVEHVHGIWHDEYQRLDDYIARMLAPCDNTPIQTHTRNRRTDVETARERALTALAAETALLDKICNALVAASIDPDTLQHWEGHLAIDETLIALSTNGVQFDDPQATQTATALGFPYSHHRRHRHASVTGATLAIAASNPYKQMTPRVALGIGFADSQGQINRPALAAIDGASGNFPRNRKGSHNFYVVVDMAYIAADEFSAHLLVRGYDILSDQPRGWIGQIVLAPIEPDDTRAPVLSHGRIHCPGADPRSLAAFPQRLPAKMTDAQIRTHGQREEQFNATVMPTNGRPVETTRRKPGRPKKEDQPADETVYKMKVYCPAAVGAAQCALKPTNAKNLPVVLSPADLANYPTPVPGICQPNRVTTTVTLDERQFKRYSDLARGTFEHTDYLATNRSANERTNGTAKRRDRGGGNLTDQTVTSRSNPEVAIAITLRVCIANLRLQELHRETIAAVGGRPLYGRRKQLKALRDLILNPWRKSAA